MEHESSESSKDSSETGRRKNATSRSDISVLIIGATGRTGLACLRRFSRIGVKPKLHAFCRNPSKLSGRDGDICETIFEGDATNEADLKCALKETKANVVIVCIGNGTCLRQSDVRTKSGQALANVMMKRKYRHIRAIVLSRLGVGDSRGIVGIGQAMSQYYFRFVVRDHEGQEEALVPVMDRITIVRPTALRDDVKATGKIQEFRGGKRPPTFSTPRDDLASWIMNEVCCGFPIGGRVSNITGLYKRDRSNPPPPTTTITTTTTTTTTNTTTATSS